MVANRFDDRSRRAYRPRVVAALTTSGAPENDAAPRGGPRDGRKSLRAVERVPDERAYLHEIIETIGSGPDLGTILRGIVHVVTEATRCHACLVWFVQDDRLVLRCASAPYADLAGTVAMGLDEGLGGWVVRTRRSAFIRENALGDPRVRYFPELEEERFQSLVSVPIMGRSGDVIGVIALHAEAPHEFARADLDFLEHTASLIAGAVENASLYEQATERIRILTGLSEIAQEIASAGSVDEVLEAVREGLTSVFGATRTAVHLDEHDGTLRLDAPTSPSTQADAERIALALWGPQDAVPIVAPLVVQGERLGLIAALLPTPVPDAPTALASVASHASVALKQHELIGSLTERNLLKDFLLALAGGDADPATLARLARRLRCDLDAPHLIVHVVAWRASGSPERAAPWPEQAASVEGRLVARFPGILLDMLEGALRALLPVDGTSEEAVEALRSMDWGSARAGAGSSVGVSNVCRGAASFVAGFEEAVSAAEVGGLIRSGPGVTTHPELGPYRYVLHAHDGVRDREQRRLEALVDYDRRRGARLLDTLEAFLDHRGNIAEASRALFIHPNTLRQRLDRIGKVAGIDLDRDDWLSVAVATKSVKLQRLRSTRAKEEI